MKVYRNYYGASVNRGIGIQAQTPEIQQLNLDGTLKELSSMHALESSEHEKEMLSYLVEKNGYGILGVSYTEQPKSSGYNRSAPCGIQYIIPMEELAEASTELGNIVNFVNFQKPDSERPPVLNSIPRNESGYTFHNSPAIIAPIIDNMVKVATSQTDEILIIALPKGKNSDYATARYSIAELLCYLPAALRTNIRFFTGLPVLEGKTDPIEGLDNAVRLGANVIFCPNEYFRTLISHRNCFGVDMDQPKGSAGIFAQYIACAPDISDGLATVLSCLNGNLTYDRLNSAAEQAQKGGRVSIEKLQTRLAESEKECWQLERQLQKASNETALLQQDNKQLNQQVAQLNQHFSQQNQQISQLNQENEKLNERLRVLQKQQNRQSQPISDDEDEGNGSSILKAIVFVLITLFMMAAAILVYNAATRGFNRIFDFSRIPQETAAPIVTETAAPITPEPTDEPTAIPTETPTEVPTDTPTIKPTEKPTEAPAKETNEIEEETAGIKSYVIVTDDAGVNLRSKPQVNSELIKKLRKGNRLVFIKQVTNDDNEIWYYVQYKGNTGYVNSDFVTLLDSKPDSEQVADT